MGCGASAGSSQEVSVASAKRSPRNYTFKLLVIGDMGVGKSSLMFQYVDRSFTQKQMSTLGADSRTRNIKLDEDIVDLQIWDTAGQERFQSLSNGYYHGADGVMIVYDVTKQKSFNNIKMWLDDVERYHSGDVVKVLVGSKCDLTADTLVDYTTAKEYADELGIPFLQTSAKDNINVDEAFITLAETIKKRKDSEPEVPIVKAVPK